MKKSILSSILFVAMAVTLCACSSGTSSSSQVEPKNNNANEQSATEHPSMDDFVITDLTFMLDGAQYTLPCDFSEFENNGWTIVDNLTSDSEYDETEIIECDKISDVFQIEKNGSSYSSGEITIRFVNDGTERKAIKDCKVGNISFNPYLNSDESDFPEIVLAGNFVVNKSVTADDIIAKYGEPTSNESSYFKDSDGSVFPVNQIRYAETIEDSGYLKTVEFIIGQDDDAYPHKNNEFSLSYIKP